jgi:hypothetical protein
MSQNQQEQSEAKLLAFIEGELDDAGRAEIEKHLEAHPQHRKLLEDMRGMRDWVRWLPKETAPAELAESFQMRLERTMLLDHAEGAGRRPMRLNRWPQLRAAAAVAALAVGLGAAVYFVLPKRQSPFAAAPSATRPSNRVIALNTAPTTEESKLLDSIDHDKQARASDGVNRLADAPTDDFRREATPATAPAEAETALAKGLSTDAMRKFGAEGLGRAAGGAGGSPPAQAEADKKTAEPTEQLAEIARNTYSLVSEDPALGELLRNSNSGKSPVVPPGNAQAMFGAAATDAARAEKAAAAPPAGSTASKGSTNSPQASSPPAGSLQAGVGRTTRAPFVMVVLAADTDRAHKQIGDYLAAKGIETQAVNDGYSRRVLDETAAAKPQANAAPAALPTASPVAPAAPVAAPEAPAAMAPAAAAAPAPAAARSRQALAPAAPRQQAPAPQPRLPAVPPAAPAVAPAAPAVAAAPAVPSAAPAVAAPASMPTAAPETDEKLAAKGAPPGSSVALGAEANGNIFIARRMTVRQARELQATLRQPAQSQWAAVYREPATGSSPPEQLGDMLALSPPALSVPAVSLSKPSNPPAVSPPATSLSNQPAVSLPAVSSSNPSNPSKPAGGPAPGHAPGSQPVARADGSPQKDQAAFTYAGAAGEAAAGRRSAADAVDQDKAKFAERLPGSEQETRAGGTATTRQAERALAAAAPTTPSAVEASPVPTGAGGRQDQFDRAMLREKRDHPTTAPSRPPASQPNNSLYLERAAVSPDDQPVDVVIVLQQSPQTPATQPVGK